ncbi:MAG: signal recognition particle receptor subunit alpha, partial [Candidatus Enteromonas sp.]|nr:signal recognition particle receptor subunit alpha [Candidatus Enteromonas sp.]
MAFESLTDRFSAIFKKLRGQSRLTEKNMDEMLKEIRVALLEADVNFKVVKSFTNDVKEKALGQDVYNKVNPSQMLVKICHDEIEELLGKDNTDIVYKKNGATTIMLVGLQGAGKTTSAGKLAKLQKDKLGKKVLLAPLDVYRPAAIDQLRTIANEIGVDFFEVDPKKSPVVLAQMAQDKARDEGYDVVIFDTAGRLAIDEKLMGELKDIIKETHPDEVLLLVDAMSGQDAVNVANTFN